MDIEVPGTAVIDDRDPLSGVGGYPTLGGILVPDCRGKTYSPGAASAYFLYGLETAEYLCSPRRGDEGMYLVDDHEPQFAEKSL